MSKLRVAAFALLSAAAIAIGCSGGSMPLSSPDATLVLSVSPAAGATNVDPAAPIVITFNRPMAMTVEAVTLHEGTVSGPVVAGTASWSTDRTQLTFTPSEPLKSHTTYVLHLLPSLVDTTGRPVNYGSCAGRLGGQPGPGAGMHRSGQWERGMVLTFTTS